MNESIAVDYEGATLAVEFDRTHARLRINGLVRDAGELGHGTLRLSSTVQTGYEWHEFIEAIITEEPDALAITMNANGAELHASRQPQPESSE